jgi:hypothetical protein
MTGLVWARKRDHNEILSTSDLAIIAAENNQKAIRPILNISTT